MYVFCAFKETRNDLNVNGGSQSKYKCVLAPYKVGFKLVYQTIRRQVRFFPIPRMTILHAYFEDTSYTCCILTVKKRSRSLWNDFRLTSMLDSSNVIGGFPKRGTR